MVVPKGRFDGLADLCSGIWGVGVEDVRPAWLRAHTGSPRWLRGPLDSLVEGWSAEAAQWSRWHRVPAPVAVRLGGTLDEVIAEMVATPHSAALVETSAGWSALFRPLNDPHAAYACPVPKPVQRAWGLTLFMLLGGIR